MALNPGDADCTFGLSKDIYDALVGDARLPWPSPFTDEQKATPKAVSYAIASKVAASVNADLTGTSWWNGTPQSVPTATSTIVNFDNHVRGEHGSLSGGGWRYTAPSAGWYSVSAMVDLYLLGSGLAVGKHAFLTIYINGAETRILGHVVGTGSTTHGPSIGGSTTLYLSAGDVLTIQFWHDADASVTFRTGLFASYVDVARLVGG